MSKKIIIFLIVFMAVVMSCLILIQTISLKKAFDIREEQFDQKVDQTIRRIIDKLESDELRDMPRITQSNNFFPSSGRSSSIIRHSLGLELNIDKGVGSILLEDRLIIAERGRPGEFQSAFDPIFDQDNHLGQRYTQQLREQADKLIALDNHQARMANLPLKERVNQQKLEYYLQSEFKNSNIDLDFLYAVKSYSKGEEQFVFGNPDYNVQNRKEYRDVLFHNDVNPKSNYLRVYFPKRETYILKETGIIVLPTIVLITVLILIFTYVMMVILKQKKLSDIKNDFINNMTHELKTPISTLSLAGQMLHDNSFSNSPKTIERVSGIILEESKRLSYHVEKVLQMAVFDEGRLHMKFKEFQMNDIIRTVVRNFELKVKDKDGKLTTELLAENDYIKGDEIHITNVLFNLLDNAVKYSKEAPKISITTENKNEGLVVSVKDNGIGIPKEHLEQIFERFFRVPTGNLHDVKGFGLGLHYVKKIIDLHQGRIKAESVINKGTKFVIYFPLNSNKNGNKSKTSVS